MSSYVQVPLNRLSEDVLLALLEEFASRDGTDYGAVELTLEQKAGNLRRQLEREEVAILFDTESEQWDLVAADQLQALLQD
ncbi:MAG: YheU family protein [Halieaceae bacterium]|nr:YheU family protein [Halieaceae bacterium]